MFEFKNTSLQQKQRFRLRALVGAAVVLVCFGMLVSRFWVLQVVRYQGLSERADRNRIALVPIAPRRGEIYDRNGEVLARNYRTYTLEVTPADFGGGYDYEKLFDRLSRVIYLSPSDKRKFKRQLGESSRMGTVTLRDNLNDTEASWFAAHAFMFPGVELKARWVRQYPEGAAAAQVVGYISRISDSDLDELDKKGETGNYRGTEYIGKKGIEQSYEKVLHGTTGVQEVEITAGGRPVRTLSRNDPVAGSDLTLSLDMGLQRVAEQAFGGENGALVAIDPNTGEVLAFVSMPSYDPNLFVNGIDVDNWKQLNESPDHPLLDRPLTSAFPIGSTYKPFVALAMLTLGKRDPNAQIPDPGYFEFGGQKFHNSGGEAFGSVDLHKAIVVSDDTYFFSLGPIIGVDPLHDFTKQFGFGQLTGIDLDGEKRGVLPSKEWKRKTFKTKAQQQWYPGESVSLTVGQGYNAFTMMQLAQAVSTLADNGIYRRPHLVHAIRDPISDKTTQVPSVVDHVIPVKQQYFDIVKSAMADVPRIGTSRMAFVGAKYQSAGKTGTAQVYSLRGAKAREVVKNLRDQALYIGFAPVDHPQIAVAVIVEHGTWGASVAAPIVRKMFDYWLVQRPKEQAAGELKNPSPVLDAAIAAQASRRPAFEGSDNAALFGTILHRQPAPPIDPVAQISAAANPTAPAPVDPVPPGSAIGPVPAAPARTQSTRGSAP